MSPNDALEYDRRSRQISLKELAALYGTKETRKNHKPTRRTEFVARSHKIETGKTKILTRKAAVLLQNDAIPANKPQARIIELLANLPDGITLTELTALANVGISPVKTLEKKGVLRIFEMEVERDPLAETGLPDIARHILTKDQDNHRSSRISKAIETGGFKAFLMHGVTGSGKDRSLHSAR